MLTIHPTTVKTERANSLFTAACRLCKRINVARPMLMAQSRNKPIGCKCMYVNYETSHFDAANHEGGDASPKAVAINEDMVYARRA